MAAREVRCVLLLICEEHIFSRKPWPTATQSTGVGFYVPVIYESPMFVLEIPDTAFGLAGPQVQNFFHEGFWRVESRLTRPLRADLVGNGRPHMRKSRMRLTAVAGK
jgi:hypothetical protein